MGISDGPGKYIFRICYTFQVDIDVAGKRVAYVWPGLSGAFFPGVPVLVPGIIDVFNGGAPNPLEKDF